VHLRCAFIIAVVIISFQPPAAFSATCPNLSLETILDQAADYMRRGAARSAVDQLYEPCSTADTFSRGSDQLKERFLFEYVDACILASHRRGIQPGTKERFLRKGIAAAQQYIDWYHTLGARRQEQLLSTNQRRIGRIVHNLIELHIETNQRSLLLGILEDIAEQNPAYLGPQSAERWEEHLKLDAEFKNRRTDAEIMQACRDDTDYRLHWELFREFLENVRNSQSMRLTVRRINARIHHISCGASA
jgi:hypothetical protein